LKGISIKYSQRAEEITYWRLKNKIRKVKIFKALLEALTAENTRITECRDVTPSI